jgi:predicted transcriptional regulator
VKGIRIRPEQRGIRATLFDLEADVMEIVWPLEGEWFAIAYVHEALQKQRTIAYTSVMTTVRRLFDKGLLARKPEGKRYLYRAKLDKAELLQSTARQVLARSGDAAAVALLVDRVAQADEEELDMIERLIRERRKQRPRK